MGNKWEETLLYILTLAGLVPVGSQHRLALFKKHLSGLLLFSFPSAVISNLLRSAPRSPPWSQSQSISGISGLSRPPEPQWASPPLSPQHLHARPSCSYGPCLPLPHPYQGTSSMPIPLHFSPNFPKWIYCFYFLPILNSSGFSYEDC